VIRVPARTVWRPSSTQAVRERNVRSHSMPVSLGSRTTRALRIGSTTSIRNGPTRVSDGSAGARREP
jgi:hypothetical protein